MIVTGHIVASSRLNRAPIQAHRTDESPLKQKNDIKFVQPHIAYDEASTKRLIMLQYVPMIYNEAVAANGSRLLNSS